jgi:nucleoside-diphosphate-sugar epimerase
MAPIITTIVQALAEKAAWEFMDKEQPHFDLAALNPPLVYGPIAHHLESLEGLNTSNQRIHDFLQGKVEGPELPPTGTFLFTDVRDIALAHVKAIEVTEAGGRRFFITGGHCSHKRMVDAMARTHPEIRSRLPQNPVDDFPANVYGYDNQQAINVLGIEFYKLQQCIDDTTSSLLRMGA